MLTYLAQLWVLESESLFVTLLTCKSEHTQICRKGESSCVLRGILGGYIVGRRCSLARNVSAGCIRNFSLV